MEEKKVNSRKSWMVLTLAVIWLAVLAASLFAPDMVTGSEQAHTPVAAIITWLFGLGSTRTVIKMMGRPKPGYDDAHPIWMYTGLSVMVIWLAASLATILSPVKVTGADPTRFPAAVLIAPVAGMALTGLVGQLFESRQTA